MTTLLAAVQQISDAEQQLASVAESLLHLYELGALAQSDIARYDALRIQLFGAQIAAYAQVLTAIRAAPSVPNQLLGQVPVPTIAPPIPVRPNFYVQISTPPSPSVSGLGNPIVVAVGGVSLSIPVWAAVVVVLIIAVAAVAAFAATVQLVTASEQIDANAEATSTYYQTVLGVVQRCRASGGSAQECAALANGIRTPREAAPEGPQTTPPGGDYTQAAKWAAVAVVGVLGAILVSWTIIRSPRSSGGGGGERESAAPRRYYLQEG